MKTLNSFHPRRLMQVFVDAGILASVLFVAASGYATTLYRDTNGSTNGSGNTGGDWNMKTTRTIITLISAVLLGLGGAQLTPALAADLTLKGMDASNTSSFTSPLTGLAAGWGPSGLAPTSGTNYLTGTYTLRSPIGSGSYTFPGASLSIDAGGNFYLKGNTTGMTLTINNLKLNGGAILQIVGSAGCQTTLDGTISLSATSSLLAKTNESLIVAAKITGGASAGLNIGQSGSSEYAGDVKLSNDNNDYTGTTHILSGTLYVWNSNVIPDASAVVIDTGAILSFTNSGGRSDTIGSLAGSGSVWMKAADFDPIVLACGGDNSSTEFSGSLVGGITTRVGRFLKQGTGVLTLSGTNNTYSDRTIVSNGTLRVTGKHTGGNNYIIAPSATLGGTGTITLATTTNNVRLIGSDAAHRAKLAPGVSGAGTLTISNGAVGTNVVFDAYSELQIALTGDTVTKLACGAMDLGGTTDYLTINVTGTRTRSRYVFATYTGSLAGNVFDQVTITGASNGRIDYSIPGEIAIIVARGTMITIF
jgi:autotransporter-associated beta strand protein